MIDRFTPDIEGLPKLTCFVAPLIPGIALTMIFLNGAGNLMAMGLFLSFVPALVFGLLLNRFFINRLHKRFFRRVLLPEAEIRSVEISDVIEMLSKVAVNDQRIDPRWRAMAKSLPLLKQLLVDQSRDLDQQDRRD
jgi:hypothetical protein